MDYQFIVGTKLFEGVTVEEAEAMLGCLGAQEKTYARGEVIYHAGQHIGRMGLLLEGGVNIVRPDIWGNENIIGHILPGEVFAETYACSHDYGVQEFESGTENQSYYAQIHSGKAVILPFV